MEKTIIAGIDPGLANTGYGVIEKTDSGIGIVECGVITTRPNTHLSERLVTIFRGIGGVLRQHEPKAIAVEDIHFRAQIVRAAILMGHARGAAVMAAADLKIPVFDYQPKQAKNVVTGSGRADKVQVMRAMAAHFQDWKAGRNEHVADALALALCHMLIATAPAFASGKGWHRFD